jgi:hypothetical protein
MRGMNETNSSAADGKSNSLRNVLAYIQGY